MTSEISTIINRYPLFLENLKTTKVSKVPTIKKPHVSMNKGKASTLSILV